MKKTIILLILLPFVLLAQEKEKVNWKPLKTLVGKWQGMSDGKFGKSKVEREYQFILNGKFIQGLNKSVYEKQEKNPKGELHEHMDLFSYDFKRKKFVFRQFHNEGMVNQFINEKILEGDKSIVFITESIENFAEGWRAKEQYDFLNKDEFVEIFSLAAPGKEFEVYVETRFKRIK